MHIGRSHHRSAEIILTIAGGFISSFLAFVFATYSTASRSLSGQLVAGDPAINREFPTTLNAIRATVDGTGSLSTAMSSFAWWNAVIIGGIVCSFILFRLIRRYV